MTKPKIRINFINGLAIYNCEDVNKAYGVPLRTIGGIMYVLKQMHYLRKDENGNYINATNQ